MSWTDQQLNRWIRALERKALREALASREPEPAAPDPPDPPATPPPSMVDLIIERVSQHVPKLAANPRYRQFLESIDPRRLATIHENTIDQLRPKA